MAKLITFMIPKPGIALADVVVDYQHGSLMADPEAAKAAGWMRSVFLKERGMHLWANVRWTKKAVEYINNGCRLDFTLRDPIYAALA